MVGCSWDWPLRKCEADLVKMTLMDSFWCFERAEIMLGSLIVATEPLLWLISRVSKVTSKRCRQESLRS
jgi:hypothetical protein